MFHWKTPATYKNFDFKKNKVRIALALLIPILFIGLFSGDNKNKPPEDGSSDIASSSQSFQSLSADERSAIKDMFNLAQQHYRNIRYELCLTELDKLHEIIPTYKNSKNLKQLCEQGSKLLRIEKDREAREKRKQETEDRIVTTAEYCKSQLKDSASIEEAQNCLQEAIELDPGHPSILAILDEIKLREQQKDDAQAQAAKIRQLKQKGRSHYARAKRLVQKDELNRSIKELQRFLNAKYPGLNKEEASARRELASVKKKLNKKVETLLEECQALRSNGKYKLAWVACDKATKEDASNKKAIDLKQEALSDLRREMKSIYQDSILEESLGNVDAAKEKWRLIRKNNLKFDEYYKKATRKLKKYGEGI